MLTPDQRIELIEKAIRETALEVILPILVVVVFAVIVLWLERRRARKWGD